MHELTNTPNCSISQSSSDRSPAFSEILQTRLQELEETQAEIKDAQTWLLENAAPLDILANQNTAVTYLSNHQQALIQPIRIMMRLQAFIQALLLSRVE